MVTAELAACLPVLVLLVAVALGAVTAAGAAVRVQDAVAGAARAAARGDPGGAVAVAAARAPGARLDLRRDGALIRASATLHVSLLGSWLPGMVIHEQAVAVVEPAVVEPAVAPP
jgi:hypothetical protein